MGTPPVSPASKYLQAFNAVEELEVKQQLTGLVGLIRLAGGNLEEGHWAKIYRNAKGLPAGGWSNQPFKDFIQAGTGVEWKLYGPKWKSSWFGRSFMHPAATRTITWNPSDPPDVSKTNILNQWAATIGQFERRVEATSSSGAADIRWGIVLWSMDPPRFLYFEVPILIPNPSDYYAVQSKKTNSNLWIYENATKKKRYSATRPAKGAKLQPYFDVPVADDIHFYFEPTVRELEALWLEPNIMKRIALASVQQGRSPEELIELMLANAGI